jgi:hypothetical protein
LGLLPGELCQLINRLIKPLPIVHSLANTHTHHNLLKPWYSVNV